MHCFRRGAAQHRFFHSKRAWPLIAIKAWGGWDRSYNTDTLINYIMNEYELRESDFSDMMNPDLTSRRDHNLSILAQDNPNESNFDSLSSK